MLEEFKRGAIFSSRGIADRYVRDRRAHSAGGLPGAKPQFKTRNNLRPPGAAPVRIDAQHAGKVMKVARVYGTRPEIFSRP